MRRLVLLRHGQTEWNLAQRFQGHTDVDLDETGLAQARAVAPAMAALEPALLWSSDLARARRTAEVVGEQCGLVPRLDARLREYDAGVRAGLTRAELQAQFPGHFEAWMAGHADGADGAESHDQVIARVLPALEECWATLEAGSTGVVVAHGAALRTGLLAFLGWPLEQRTQMRALSNCGWVELGEGEDGRPLLAAYNRVVGG